MAYYKHGKYFRTDNSSQFDSLRTPGTVTPYSGIYRCENCGHEDVSIKGRPLPPQNHHQHAYGLGPIRWRLITATHPV